MLGVKLLGAALADGPPLGYPRPHERGHPHSNDYRAGQPSRCRATIATALRLATDVAAQKLAHEKPGQTLQATALVHEAYLRLVGGGTPQRWDSRRHFFAAAEAMRRILDGKDAGPESHDDENHCHRARAPAARSPAWRDPRDNRRPIAQSLRHSQRRSGFGLLCCIARATGTSARGMNQHGVQR